MDRLPILLLSIALLATGCHEHAQIEKTPFSHFQDGKTIGLTIETDWKKLLLGAEEAKYQPAVLTLQKDKCADEHFHVEVKPRGVFRKQTCDFPPLKIRFPDEVMAEAEMDDHATLKLVAHCRLDSAYEQLVLKEYLVFKLYNVLTDSSFQIQLARIKYTDSGGTMPDFERFGFLIENPDELAARMGGRILGEETGAPSSIHKPQYKLFTLFQFMVGNTDWALKNRHNVKLVQPLEGEAKLPIPVPYDFDFSGLVNAPYAMPHHTIPVEVVTERYFQWKGKKEEDFSAEVALFLAKKKELLSVVESCGHLTAENRAETLGYLRNFFEIIEREGANEKGKFVEGE